MQWIENLDIFGEEVKLNLCSKEKFQSKFGGCVSLVAAILLLIIIISGLSDLFNKVNFEVSTRTRLEVNPELAIFDVSNFMFAIKVSNPILNDSYKHKRFSTITITQTFIHNYDDGTETEAKDIKFQLEPCTLTHFRQENSNYEKEYKKNGIQNYFCFPLDYKLELQGQYTSNQFYYGKVQVELCLDEEDCLTQEEFDKLQENGQIKQSFEISTVITNSIIDLYGKGLENQIQNFLFQDFFFYGSYTDSYQKSDIFIQKNQLNVDESLLPFIKSQELVDLYTVSMRNIRTLEYKDQNKQIFSKIYLRMAYEYILYDKKYQQLDDFLSYIGGLLKIILSVLGILVIQYNKISVLVHIANQLYQFDLPQNNSKVTTYQSLLNKIYDKIHLANKNFKKLKHSSVLFSGGLLKKNQSQSNKINNASVVQTNLNQSKNNLLNDQQKEVTDNSNLHEENENQQPQKIQIQQSIILKNDEQGSPDHKTPHEKHPHHHHLDHHHHHISHYRKKFLNEVFHDIVEAQTYLMFTFKYIISYIFCFKIAFDEKNQLIKKTLDLVTQDLDIIVIIDRLQDVDKLKQVIFNENQKLLFNYTPKPVISLQEDAHQLELKNEEKEFQQELDDIDQKAGQKNTISQIKKTLFSEKTNFTSKHAFFKLYHSYDKLIHQNGKEEDKKIKQMNEKLMKLIGTNLIKIFETSYEIDKKQEEQKKKTVQLEQKEYEKINNQEIIIQKKESQMEKEKDNKFSQQKEQRKDLNIKMKQGMVYLSQKEKNDNEDDVIVF